MQTATIYFREDSFYIVSNSQTVDGAWVANTRLHRIELGDDLLLGEKTRDALAHSRNGIPHPTDFRALIAPLLTISKQKTWTQFADKSSMVLIQRIDDRICLTPHRNFGGGGGFEGFRNDEYECAATVDSAELGGRIREAFERCE